MPSSLSACVAAAGLGSLARVVLQALRHAPFADLDSRAVRLELRGGIR